MLLPRRGDHTGPAGPATGRPRPDEPAHVVLPPHPTEPRSHVVVHRPPYDWAQDPTAV